MIRPAPGGLDAAERSRRAGYLRMASAADYFEKSAHALVIFAKHATICGEGLTWQQTKPGGAVSNDTATEADRYQVLAKTLR